MLLVVGLLACGSAERPPNLLLLVADDLGVDMLAAYGLGGDLPLTPNVDALANSGVLFRNVWSTPICSPTRAGILTGRYSFRTGLGTIVKIGGDFDLQPGEVTLPEMLDAHAPVPYRHAAFGKWHLSADPDDLEAPNRSGFSHFDGSLFNFIGEGSYYEWPRVVDGRAIDSDRYATTQTVDSVVEWVKRSEEPWLAYVAFHAPHSPYEDPPAKLHQVDLSGEDARSRYKAMVEALDTEIGRLLAELGPEILARTVVFFVGDNGTPPRVTVPPFLPEHAKPTMYQGGIAVPLIVSGSGVVAPGRASDAFVHTTDIFATVAELAGIDPLELEASGPTLDSVSFAAYLADPNAASKRDTLFTERFRPMGGNPNFLEFAIRGPRYKLIASYSKEVGDGSRWTGSERFFDLVNDPHETINLMEGAGLDPQLERRHAELLAEHDRILRRR